MKAYWGSRIIPPHILDLGTRWRWVVNFTPRPLYPQGKSLWYTLNRRLGGPKRGSGRGGEEKNSQPLPGLEPPMIKLVAYRYTTELSWLLDLHNIKGKVKLSLCFNWAPRHGGVFGEWRYSSTHYLTSALYGGEWSASRSGRFTHRERAPGTHLKII
jgi:hypothetical protein